MKIMVVASPHAFATRDVYTGHVNGLRAALGEENVVTYDIIPRYNIFHMWTEWLEGKLGYVPRELAANVMAAEPVFGAAHWHNVDVVYFVSPMYFPMSIVQLLRKDGFKAWAYFTECPYEDEFWARSQANHFDYCFVNDKNSVPRFRMFNEKTFYVAHAYDPARHYPGRGPTRGHEHVVYVGTGFPARRKLLESVDWSGIDLRVYGNWEEVSDSSSLKPYIRPRLVHNEFTAAIYRGASIGISMHREERQWGSGDLIDPGEAYSLGPRSYELAACGLVQVSDRRPEIAEIFGNSVPTFWNPESLEESVRYLLENPAMRRELASQQLDAVRPHTVEARARQMLTIAA